ncbi:hypothetical protein LSAT2_025568 [Lamellibrachia satsuma]|nr:hypothetical protein LSAT2_025568 [Lamellibrachia satsuma]
MLKNIPRQDEPRYLEYFQCLCHEATTMSLVSMTVTILLLSPLMATADFPECPSRCPKGQYATEVTNVEGVLICICKDPCENHRCPPCEKCVLQTIYCYRAPCPPIPNCLRCLPCTGGRVRRTGRTAYPTATCFKPEVYSFTLAVPVARCECPRRCPIRHVGQCIKLAQCPPWTRRRRT